MLKKHLNQELLKTSGKLRFNAEEGTYDDPYIIENLTIDAEYSGSGIEIRNSDV
ncbi:hypothetical protein LCGC14_2574060 [marine sediment metagenome]|uniref:Uncharacterized protein n=1 Tax=marine sediment metagenome TaxID=412755 RepID=A0A0F9D963_9ZZZZ